MTLTVLAQQITPSPTAPVPVPTEAVERTAWGKLCLDPSIVIYFVDKNNSILISLNSPTLYKMLGSISKSGVGVYWAWAFIINKSTVNLNFCLRV